MGVLQQEVRSITNSADKAVECSKETFGQLFHPLEQVFSDIKRQVRSTQSVKVSQVKESLRRQVQEVTELRRCYTEHRNKFPYEFSLSIQEIYILGQH